MMSTQRELAFNQIRQAILDGSLKPGDPISEREFSKQSNVSRVPIREALIQLEACGLVSYRKARGAFVRAFEIKEIKELYQIRESLEGQAAHNAAGSIPTH